MVDAFKGATTGKVPQVEFGLGAIRVQFGRRGFDWNESARHRGNYMCDVNLGAVTLCHGGRVMQSDFRSCGEIGGNQDPLERDCRLYFLGFHWISFPHSAGEDPFVPSTL